MTEAPTIFITGATDGLGRALAGRLAADGASLILHGRDAGKLESTAAEIAAEHGVDHPSTVRADLADLAQVASWPPTCATLPAGSTCSSATRASAVGCPTGGSAAPAPTGTSCDLP